MGVSAGAEQLLDRMVARVGDVTITRMDVQAALEFGLVEIAPGNDREAEALNRLIDRHLALEEIERGRAPTPDPAAVDAEVARLKANAGSRLPSIMTGTGVDEARLRAMAVDTVRIRAYLQERFPSVPVSDFEAEQYYRANPEAFRRDGTIMPLQEALPQARAAASQARRQTRIAQWLANLRNRGDVQRARP